MSAQRRAVFRCDAGIALGGGHAMRCLSLASAFERAGWSTAFAVLRGSEAVVPALHGRDLLLLDDPADAQALLRRWPDGIDLLVVDHYGLDARFEAACAVWARRRLVIDDLADRPHDADMLLDQTYGRRPDDYRGLVQAGCRMLIGPAFALLRSDFAALRPRALDRRSGALARILVSFGATDPVDATSRVLAGIALAGLDVAVDVVLGREAPFLDTVRQALGAGATLHVGTGDMARLMLDADLAFGAGGSTAWERCCLGLPSVILTLADNQRLVARALAEAGAGLWLGEAPAVSADDIAATLRGLDGDALGRLSAAAFGLCDGRGADRVVRAVTGDDGGVPRVRPAVADDAESLFTWKNEPAARASSITREPVSWADHLAWFRAGLAGDRRRIFIAECDGAPVGAVRFDIADEGAVVSLVLAPEARGRGLAADILAAGIAAFPAARLEACIRTDNFASRKVFARNGFVVDGEADGILYATRLP